MVARKSNARASAGRRRIAALRGTEHERRGAEYALECLRAWGCPGVPIRGP